MFTWLCEHYVSSIHEGRWDWVGAKCTQLCEHLTSFQNVFNIFKGHSLKLNKQNTKDDRVKCSSPTSNRPQGLERGRSSSSFSTMLNKAFASLNTRSTPSARALFSNSKEVHCHRLRLRIRVIRRNLLVRFNLQVHHQLKNYLFKLKTRVIEGFH